MCYKRFLFFFLSTENKVKNRGSRPALIMGCKMNLEKTVKVIKWRQSILNYTAAPGPQH